MLIQTRFAGIVAEDMSESFAFQKHLLSLILVDNMLILYKLYCMAPILLLAARASNLILWQRELRVFEVGNGHDAGSGHPVHVTVLTNSKRGKVE